MRYGAALEEATIRQREKPEQEPRITREQWRRIMTVDAGYRMLAQEAEEPADLRAVVWRLLQEALQTERALKRPGPKPPGTAMPEYHHTHAEIFATYVEQHASGIVPAPDNSPPPAKADAIERLAEVTTWFRYVRSHNTQRARRMLALLAAGASPTRCAAMFGFPGRRAVEAAKFRYIGCIVDRLKRDLPKNYR